MRVLTTDGRMAAVPHAAETFPSPTLPSPSYTSRGSVELLRDADGMRRTVRYAAIARTNPWVSASVNERAGLASRVPIHVYRPDPEGREGHRQRVRIGDGGPGARLPRLLAHPEERLSGRRLRRRLVGDFLTHGNALAEMVFDASEVVGLRWHPWVGVEPKLSDDGLSVLSFDVPVKRRLGWLLEPPKDGRNKRTIDASEVLHLAINDDTESPLGVSPLASLHATHALHEAAWRFARAYLEEGMFPSGVIELPHQATVAQARLTRELLADLHTGVERGGKPGVIGFGTWKQVMATPEGAKLVELARASREEVSAAYRVPTISMGDTESSNRATADITRKQFIRDVVGEDVAVLETEYNAQLIEPRRRWASAGVFVEAQLGELLRPDLEALSEVIERQVGGPVMEIDEGRHLLNLPPLPNGKGARLLLSPGTPESKLTVPQLGAGGIGGGQWVSPNGQGGGHAG